MDAMTKKKTNKVRDYYVRDDVTPTAAKLLKEVKGTNDVAVLSELVRGAIHARDSLRYDSVGDAEHRWDRLDAKQSQKAKRMVAAFHKLVEQRDIAAICSACIQRRKEVRAATR